MDQVMSHSVRVHILTKDGRTQELEFARERLSIDLTPVGLLVLNERESMSPTSPKFSRYLVQIVDITSITVVDVE